MDQLGLVVSVRVFEPGGLADGPCRLIRLVFKVLLAMGARPVHDAQIPVDEHEVIVGVSIFGIDLKKVLVCRSGLLPVLGKVVGLSDLFQEPPVPGVSLPN